MNYYELPVYQQKQKILDALTANKVIVVESPTGSGKTTQLPMILYEAGYADSGMIGITQPRRIAAVSVCEYISHQLETTVPGKAGYTIRFDDKTDKETKIKIMTDGILLQELKTDRYLSQYNVIVVDEAHERSLNIDFILGLLKHILEVRNDFKVIISSATINAEIFSEYFGGVPIVNIDTMMYPVGIVYDPPKEEAGADGIIHKIVEIISRILHEKREGDILIFLSGERQIKDCMKLLSSMTFAKKLWILPLYGRLSKEEQEYVFIPTPENKIKVVISTNIAETSVTIDGITSVIDSGLAKINYYNPRTFTSSLIETDIAKASCNQRKGRAGRTRPGTCYRLYSKKDYDARPLFTTEEIYRTDLSEVVLRMAEIGIGNFESFNFISPPGKEGIHSAVETLLMLQALTPENELSSVGKMMAEFPLLPRFSRIIVEAINKYPRVIEEVLIGVSFLSTHTPFLLPHGEEIAARKAHHTFQHPYGDFISYLKLFRAYVKAENKKRFCSDYFLDERTIAEIVNIKGQLEEIVSAMGIPVFSSGSTKDYLCSVAAGLLQFVCIRSKGNSYRSLTADRIQIHPGSVMFRETPKYIVAGEIVRTSRMFARSVSPLRKEWLPEISGILSEHLIPRSPGKPSLDGTKQAKTDGPQPLILGSQVFPVKPYKGKKYIVELPWKQLSKICKKNPPRLSSKNTKLRGTVLLHKCELMAGEKLKTILKIAPLISPEEDMIESWPKGRQYYLPGDFDELYKHTDIILSICRNKKKSKKYCGFLSLNTDAVGTFWFSCSKGFHNALSQSISSIEILIDQLEESDKKFDKLNAIYRKLTTLFDQL